MVARLIASGEAAERMSNYAFVAPILLGKLEGWRKWQQELTGTRRAEFMAARKRAGIRREEVFLQQTPHGDFGVVVWDCDDPAGAMKQLASADSFDVWFASKLKEFHGIDTNSIEKFPINPKTLNIIT